MVQVTLPVNRYPGRKALGLEKRLPDRALESTYVDAGKLRSPLLITVDDGAEQIEVFMNVV